MKEVLVAIFALFNFSYVPNIVSTNMSETMVLTDNYVVFRSTQKLESRDGRSIYLYTNRTCELFDGDRLIVKCTYQLLDNEVRLLDENGDTVYKGTYRLTADRRNVSSLTLAGTTYYRK